MKYDNENRVFLQIGLTKRLNIRVFLDDIEIYSGEVEDAPDNVKELYYTHIEITDKFEYYCYNSLQKI